MRVAPRARRLFAELLGALLLEAAVIGSGIMAERLAGGNLAVALLANTAATVAALATLIAVSIRRCTVARGSCSDLWTGARGVRSSPC